ncbi:XRE family transcriptional regulator [Sedimentibacter saalensis]|uniref:Transcriptional regulator with XRE-family HTH domain n=1 Tax=Sedimentibacter saalensis TaxID=130788 RepID=A0A562JHA8_9FIRM|nr:XRE family transcriptional regulator [Sedimentibacter saalensis]TWH82652.1 transcriptional regulator with XRE-family HTH domain [Sedimentibacter saalensis]
MDGNKVRKLRKHNEMTIDELAEKSGFTSSYISQVERNLIEPSLTALTKICRVFGISPYYFLDETVSVTVTRKEDRQRLIYPEKNQELEFLLPIGNEQKNNMKFSIFKSSIEPGKWDSENFLIIDSDKCVIIIKGKLIVNFADYNEIIEEGDSIYICSNIPHKLFNPSEETTEIMCIASPGIY